MALSDNLISYWKLDEASGNATDSHGSNTLTDTNTVGSTTGKIGNARDFERDNNEYFSKTSNASLQTGDIDFSFAGWVNFESLGGAARYLISKWSGANHEYSLRHNTSFIVFTVSPSSGVYVDAIWGSGSSTATWYYLAGGHNATANEVWVSVNAATPVTTSHSGGVRTDSGNLNIGADGFDSNTMDGLMDEWGFWKRDIRSDLSELYNSGSGRDYSYITGGGGGGTVIPVFMNQYRQRWS